MITVQRATRTELASTLQQSGLSVRAFCNDAGLPKTTVRRFLSGQNVRPSTHSQIHNAVRSHQADRLAAVQSANAASRQCYLDGITASTAVDADMTHRLVDDLLESEKSQMRQTIETQRENIKTLQEKLSESERHKKSHLTALAMCTNERNDARLDALKKQSLLEIAEGAIIYHEQQPMDAMHDHALTIDATRQAHAVLMHQIEVEQSNFRKQGWMVWFLIALLAICCAVMSFGGAS